MFAHLIGRSFKLFSLVALAVAVAGTLGSSGVLQPQVTATIYAHTVRFQAQGEVQQFEVAIFNLAGQKLFDSGRVNGQVLEWRMLDSRGQVLANGVYLYLVTIKDRSDHTEQKVAKLVLLRGLAGLQATPPPTVPFGQVITPATFALSAPGVALEQPSTLLVAAQLNNTGKKSAFNLKITSVQLDSASVLTPTPILVGDIAAGGNAVVQANFNGSMLTPRTPYQLIMSGSYQTARRVRKLTPFTVQIVITLPPPAPGEAPSHTVDVLANKVSGAPFPPQPPSFNNEVNPPSFRTIPTGKFIPGTAVPSPTSVQKAPIRLGQEAAIQGQSGTVVFKANNSLGFNANTCCAEPSGASGGGMTFITVNSFAAYSTNGGATFTQLNPTTIFPNTADGGFCCDQIVQYVPGIDRFIWLMQFWRGSGGSGSNRMRIASASPAAIINSKGTAWTYWDLTSGFFGLSSTSWLDYPDLSVGNNFLYMSCDEVGVGLLVARLPLSQIQASGTISVGFTDPAVSTMATYFGHLTQNTGDEIFWAGHMSNSQMRIFSWQESSGTYFWRDVGISSWANSGLSSTTPGGQDWLAAARSRGFYAVIGATRFGNQLWFAWNAGTNRTFPQSHIEMVTLDRGNNFNVLQQVQIWNPSYAFAYPALMTSTCTREVGLSFEFGGGGNYENHVVGFWGDFIAWITTGSSVGTTRFGDYVTIRQAPPTQTDPGNLFTAFGYGLNPGTDIHYVLFGRPGCR